VIKNILSDLPDSPDEIFETLLEKPGTRIERIISSGQATPQGEWYDQSDDEWVLLLSGSAGLLLEGEETVRTLKAGDFLHLPAGCRHRVEWTDPEVKSVWLAVHFYSHSGDAS
jgi:cupin 2 domain-containing protein